jgi:hypothetical protein
LVNNEGQLVLVDTSKLSKLDSMDLMDENGEEY